MNHTKPMKYHLCVIGNPVEHSISPEIHAAFARECGLTISYIKIKSERDKFTDTVMDFKNQHGFGGNVTSPFKQEAFALSTKKTERATIAQSVNTLIFRDNDIIGDNTDGIGLLRDIKNNIGFSSTDKKI